MITEAKCLTRDLGGNVNTAETGDGIVATILEARAPIRSAADWTIGQSWPNTGVV